MKALHTALNGIAIVAMIAAAPALAGKMGKNSRTVIRIDATQQEAQPANSGSVAQGTDSTQGLLLPAVQKVRATNAEPRKGGVNVAAGDVNGDGRADVVGGSSGPQASHSAKEPAYGMNQNIPRPRGMNENVPRPQQTSTQGPYQKNVMNQPAPKAIPKATLYGRKSGGE